MEQNYLMSHVFSLYNFISKYQSVENWIQKTIDGGSFLESVIVLKNQRNKEILLSFVVNFWLRFDLVSYFRS